MKKTTIGFDLTMTQEIRGITDQLRSEHIPIFFASIRYQKAGFRDTLSSIWEICAIAIIIAYFIIYLREKEGNEDKDGDMNM